jgi:ribosomal protein S18 acetylase RimI-like enzyme
MQSNDEDLLDNPVYAALSGTHARFAQVLGRARQYQVDVAPFVALPSRPSTQDWRDAAGLFVVGTYYAMLHDGAEVPPGWEAIGAFDAVQMIGERVTGRACSEAIPLGAANVPEMLELAAQTQPGPFLPRTVELGDYLGIRRDGAFVAMAVERLRFESWTEISSVCTMPAYRTHGLAAGLVGALIAGIQRRGERAFLHVLSTSTSAIRLYEQLGFRARRSATITVVTPQRVSGAQDQD